MGYTHYFQLDREVTQQEWDSFTKGVLQLRESAWEIAIDGTITPEYIDINGIGEESHENLVIQRTKPRWSFCKTNHKEYDKLVTAVLILAHYTFTNFALNSDGSWEDWQEGRELFERTFHLVPAEGSIFGTKFKEFALQELP